MPKVLVFVRHGESEGNFVKRKNSRGDSSAFTPEFLDRHSSKFRLTDKGRDQAVITGEWIRANSSTCFDRYYVSEYTRALETAALLGFKDAKWRKEFDLRERDYGFMDLLSPEQRESFYGEEIKIAKKDRFLMPIPGGGESIATMCMRVRMLFDTLHRECSYDRVCIVSHGELIWGCRIRLERITMDRYHELIESKDPFNRIHNCQVLEYTRVDPHSGIEFNYYKWMRSVCPVALSLSRNEWVPIVRTKFSNEELLLEAERYPRQIK